MPRIRTVTVAIVLAAVLAVAAACAATPSAVAPAPGQNTSVAERYLFVAGHRDVISELPCYCGCMQSAGHDSLFDCYYDDAGTYDPHAAGCGVCLAEVDIAEALLARGASVPEIRASIDATFGG
ncbi:MAG: PCYCGC motif-containing (lipo)protein [Dehalococcoidia bacterium]